MKANKDSSERLKRTDEEKRRKRLKQYLYKLVQLGVNLRQDWFFHIVFGRNESVPFLRELMNGVFRNANEPTVDAIKIKNPFTFGRSYRDKDVVVDVAVEDEVGNQYDVEMQMWTQTNFRERIVYYLEKIAAGQLSKGSTYNQLHRVIGIVFVDFPIWSSLDLQKIKNLTPDLAKKLEGTQFETIKLMSVENRVVFSDCLTIHFIQIPKANEPFSSSIRDPKLINWLKAFRFPESTSEEDMLRLETTTPELKELRKQMFELIATPKQRAYIARRQRFLITQRTAQEDADLLKKEVDALTNEKISLTNENANLSNENANLSNENANLSNENANLSNENANLSNENATLKRRLQEKDDDTQKMVCNMLVTTVSTRFNVPVSKIKTLLEGQTQKTLNAACNALTSNIDYDEFVKVVLNNQ